MELTVFLFFVLAIDIQGKNRELVENGKVGHSDPMPLPIPRAQPAMARLLQSAPMHSQCSSRSYAHDFKCTKCRSGTHIGPLVYIVLGAVWPKTESILI